MKDTVRLLCATLALVSASYASVTVSSPATGSTLGSPVHVVASASGNLPITGMRIYVDSVSVYHVSSSSINASIPVAAGKHNVVVMAWDSSGASQKSGTIAITVSSTATPTPSPTPAPSPSPTATPTPTPTPIPSPTPSPSATPSPSPSPTPVTSMPAPPANAIVKNDIDHMTGWESCTVCAGANAAGPVAVYSMTQNILSPALDGNAAQFDIGGTNAYASALWWKQLGANNAIRNFKYDLNFYLKTPQAAQALEFDVNQSDGVHKFIFGTQCNIKDGGVWDVYANAAGHWTHTNIPCAMPTAFTWHHLTWEFQRTDTSVVFIGFTYDGVTHYVNQSYPAKTSTAKEINVAFQLDLNGHADPYSAWLDKVSLTYW